MNREFTSYKDFAEKQGIVMKRLGRLFELMKFEDEHPEEDEIVKKLKEMVTVNRINWLNGLNEMLGLDVSTNSSLSEALGYVYCQVCGQLAENGGDEDGICYAGGQHNFLCDALYDKDCSTDEQCEDAMCKVCHTGCDEGECETCDKANEVNAICCN